MGRTSNADVDDGVDAPVARAAIAAPHGCAVGAFSPSRRGGVVVAAADASGMRRSTTGRFTGAVVTLLIHSLLIGLVAAQTEPSTEPAVQPPALTMSAPSRVLAFGTSNDYWVGVVKGNGSTGDPIHTVIRYRSVNETAWKPVVEIPGRVASMTSWNARLVVRMDDGSWMSLWDGGSSSGPSLPANGQLLELAANDGTLWAVGIVAGGIRAAMVDAERAIKAHRLPTMTTAPTTNPAASAPATSPATMMTTTAAPSTIKDAVPRLVLFSMEPAGWMPRAQVPQAAADQGISGVSLTAVDRTPVLGVGLPGGAIDVYRLAAGDDVSPAARISALPNVISFKLLSVPNDVLLWRGQADGAGFIQPLDPNDVPIALATPDGSTISTDRAVTTATGFLRVVYATADLPGKDALTEVRYDFTGSPQGNPTVLTAPTHSLREEWFNTFGIVTAGLVVVLLLSLLRRNKPAASE